jgi:hypothetical protein
MLKMMESVESDFSGLFRQNFRRKDKLVRLSIN